MNEEKIISGIFTSNKRGVIFEIVISIIMIICFVFTIAIPVCAIFCFVVFIVSICKAIAYHKLKDQEIIVTEQGVYGKLHDKKVELPFDMISHIESRGKKSFAIFTVSGSIIGECCDNRDDIVSSVSFLLKKRNEEVSENLSTTNPTINTDKIRMYKQLFEEGIISEEEFEAKKKQLLGI